MRMQITNESMQTKKFDQWRFLSIITDSKSYDFIMNSQKDALDLIAAINYGIS